MFLDSALHIEYKNIQRELKEWPRKHLGAHESCREYLDKDIARRNHENADAPPKVAPPSPSTGGSVGFNAVASCVCFYSNRPQDYNRQFAPSSRVILLDTCALWAIVLLHGGVVFMEPRAYVQSYALALPLYELDSLYGSECGLLGCHLRACKAAHLLVLGPRGSAIDPREMRDVVVRSVSKYSRSDGAIHRLQ